MYRFGKRTGTVRYLRSNQTTAEKILWKHLRAKRFHGLKFRRQVPIGSYIADFLCLERKLIIEADGAGHRLQKRRDEKRDWSLMQKGYTVLRFTNDQINSDLQWVLDQIAQEAGKAPSLSLEGEG